MFATLREFLESALSTKASPPPEDQERALRLAAAALLFEVVRADGRVEAAERTVLRSALHSAFDLEDAECEELLREAETQSREAASVFDCTALVDKAFTAEQKRRLIELLWLVAFADGVKEPLEEHMVRKIAGLLHVAHPDFIGGQTASPRASRPAVALP
jgi:uncharacterized tellurite resistance protein B-like protein